MKSRYLLGILSIVCLFGFVSCDKNDDDKLEYHLELSESSYEVMQGRVVSINLTAHENTTLDIKNPELIDAVYTWEFGSYKAKIEIKAKQKGETDIVVTDHETGEIATIKVNVTEYPMPHLGVKQPKGNIFDAMCFYLYNENSQAIRLNEISDLCDSIVWTTDVLNGSFRVYEHEGAHSHFSLEWTHCFKYPGEYKTYLSAWKDNKVFSRSQLDITITDNKDFLEYNWNEINKDSQAWRGYVDVLKSSPDFIGTYDFNGTIPSAEVRLPIKGFTQSYDALYNYFCKLYSAPTYEDKTEKQKMWRLYNELFSEQKKYPNAYPVAIWVTERTNIILLMLDESMEFPGYVVYAEPNRQ